MLLKIIKLMCNELNTLAKNFDGELQHCCDCGAYHLLFNNLYIQFNQREFKAFKLLLSETDVDYCKCSPYVKNFKRKIPIQTIQTNLTLMFDEQEFKSLKDLIFERTKNSNTFLHSSEIDYSANLN
ncbi:MAG: hypothetical protein CMC18_02095 [Flavobacteriaceae bacterium]|nr:hypothetical protein [Flavobacteriaceae bacterium]